MKTIFAEPSLKEWTSDKGSTDKSLAPSGILTLKYKDFYILRIYLAQGRYKKVRNMYVRD